MKKEIAIASDHGGYALKKSLIPWLKKQGYTVKNFGTNSKESVDYPEYAARVALAVSSGAFAEGILICSSGIGMSIAANRLPGIRASLCYNESTAKHTREHNLSNIICLGGHYLTPQEAQDILKAWLETPMGGKPRYQKRTQLIDELTTPGCSGCC